MPGRLVARTRPLFVWYAQKREGIGDLNQARFFAEFYPVHEDKEWGLTGCISFIVMKDHDLTEAFTSDEHFQPLSESRLVAIRDSHRYRYPVRRYLFPRC